VKLLARRASSVQASRDRRDALTRGGVLMGLDDKIEHAAEKAAGTGKEAAGKATGDEKLEAEGKADKAKASLKQAGDHVKDAFKK